MNPNRFLRTFSGHNRSAFVYARFPFEKLDKFKKFVKENDYRLYNGLDRCELRGLICIEKNGRYMALRRYNGEAYWNITNIASTAYHDFSDVGIDIFLQFLQDAGIDLIVPKTDLEYIPPSDEATREKYTDPECRGFGDTSNVKIHKIKAREKEWLKDLE